MALALGLPRSTKAGARTPATRRGRQAAPQGLPRSTKAGARTATRVESRRVPQGALNEGRGANPGDTEVVASRWAGAEISLNEGRGANPGDTTTTNRPCSPSPLEGRGAIATPGMRARRARAPALNEGRGANPGDTRRWSASATCADSTAQRRPGREPRRHEGKRAAHRAERPLNEGRGANPGDTPTRLALRHARACALNEGRGANPGDTRLLQAVGELPGTDPLNEGRGANPGDTRRRRRVARTGCRSTGGAQRRPGREPRRHICACV